MSDSFVLGIDLGTTFSCVGVYHKNNINIVENEFGNKVTSSVVTFVDNEVFVGNCPSMYKKGAQIVHNIKRFMGKKFDDKDIQHEIENYSCKLFEKNGGIAVEIDWQGGKIYKSPIEISSMILKKLKELAEQRYNSVINNCVISVPARFNNLQREETKMAGELAGLNVLQIVNEPTAAAHSFGVKHLDQSENKNVMVYDFGGGTLDVSILTITNNCFTVRGTSGNMHLGGEDMNDILEQFVLNDIKQNYPSTQINKKLKAHVRKKCEELKCQLSLEKRGEIYDETILSGEQYTLRMTRAKFESLCKKVFSEAMKPIHNVLRDTELSPDEIDEVVMVGGSSKIPKIREMVENIFQGKTLNADINPLESVAYGTTIMAANMIGLEKDDNMKAITLDVTPLTMGIEVAGKFTKAIIKRGTMFPCQRTSYFTTHEDNQETVTIKVLEGERYFSKDNHILGQFKLKNLPKRPRGSLKIEVQYHIDRDGILNIQAHCCGEKKTKQKLSIRRDDYFLNKERVEQMEKDAALFYKQDYDAKKRRNAIETYENYLFTNFQNIGDKNKSLSNLYQKEIQYLLHDCDLKIEEVEKRRTAFEKDLQEVKNEMNTIS
jgi:molecular chaperone DnaK (HSP70)